MDSASSLHISEVSRQKKVADVRKFPFANAIYYTKSVAPAQQCPDDHGKRRRRRNDIAGEESDWRL